MAIKQVKTLYSVDIAPKTLSKRNIIQRVYGYRSSDEKGVDKRRYTMP